MDLQRLLRDRDGDGLYDGLTGKLFLPKRASINTLRASSEIIACLARQAVVLIPEIAAFNHDISGFFVGRYPPRICPAPAAFEMVVANHGVSFAADTDATLLAGVSWVSDNFWLFEKAAAETFWPRLGQVKRISWQDGQVTLEFSQPLAADPVWSTIPTDIAKISAGKKTYSHPNHAAGHHQTLALSTPTRLTSLGAVFQGGGLYSGTAQQPALLQGGLAILQPCREVVAVAARLSTEGLETRLPLTTSNDAASVTLGLEQSLTCGSAEIRIAEGRLELVAQSEAALSNLALYFATTFPKLPDGTLITDLEKNLEAFLAGETRIGALATVAAQRSHVKEAKRALLPNPPACAPRLLGLPVRNTTRDGARQEWCSSFPWEGKRLLDAISTLELSAEALVITAFLSEDKATRKSLASRLKRQLRRQGIDADITLYAAYKPGLFWLSEHIAPRLKKLAAVQLTVSCAPQLTGLEVEDRWLRELYPVADMLEKQPGVKVKLELVTDQLVPYKVRAENAAGELLFTETFTPPTRARPYLGQPDRGMVYPTTGWVKVHQGAAILLDQPLPTDRDLAWDWYTDVALNALRADASGKGPFFADLTINFGASEPDESLGVDHECASALEAMHEEFYFGTLEALQEGGAFRSREISPGWVLPFCKQRPEQDVSVQVIRHAVGSLRLGLEATDGTYHPSPSYPAAVQVVCLRLEPDESLTLSLNIVTNSKQAAAYLQAKLHWLQTHYQSLAAENIPLPLDCRLDITLTTGTETVAHLTLSPHASGNVEAVELARARPLTPQDVKRQAQAFKQRFPFVHLSPVRETRLGHPLISLEASSPLPAASRARLARWKPTVLISARQHANEPTSTPANFLWLGDALPRLLRSFNVVFNPLENPDGAKLYTALCQHAPHHMHHAARYTSLGTDVQVTRTATKSATRRLHDYISERWSPLIHLNNHGYPAHEWTRPHSGYVPKHFEDWSLPFGYMTILIAVQKEAGLLRTVQAEIARQLRSHQTLADFTDAQVKRGQGYRSSAQTPFDFIGAFPFMCRVSDQTSPLDQTTSTRLTVISEVPDETVNGKRWQNCVMAHQVINQAVLDAVSAVLALTAEVAT